MAVIATVFGVAALDSAAIFAMDSGINRTLNYQGRLMGSDGRNVADGTYNIAFRLYNQASGGSHVWSASTTNGLLTGPVASIPVSVQSGLFTVALGDTEHGQLPLDIDWSQDTVYLGVTIAADSEMSPRKRMTSVPYAFNTERLQGQYASHSVANMGGDLFGLRQASSDSAVATRTALYVETKGTSDVYDFLMRLSDSQSDVFSISRQGNTWIGGSLDVDGDTTLGNASATNATISDDLYVNGTASMSRALFMNATGTNIALTGFINSNLVPRTDNSFVLGTSSNRWQGVYAVGVTTTDIYASGTVSTTALYINGQKVIPGASSSTLQDVTDNGNTTTDAIQFAGGTSTASFHISSNLTVTGRTDMQKALFINATGTNIALLGYVNSDWSPMVDNTYSLGSKTNRWKRLYGLDVYASGTVLMQNFGVYGNVSLPNDSITDAMAGNGLTIDASGNVSASSVNSGVLGNAGVTLDLSGFDSVVGNINASQVMFPATNTSETMTVQNYLNMLVTNGIIRGGDIVKTASGTIDVTSGLGIMSSHPTDTSADVQLVAWATSTGISLAYNQWEDIYVHYSSGVASIVATTTDHSGDWTYWKLASVFNVGNGSTHVHDERLMDVRPLNRIVEFLEKGIGQIITAGSILSDVGTRNLAVSTGTRWYGGHVFSVPSFDSSVTDTFTRYYRNGTGGFTEIIGQTQWDNLNYDDGSGTLQALAVGEIGVQWVFMGEDGMVSLIYGHEAYPDLASASAATIPTDLPANFKEYEHMFPIGAIVFEQGQNTVLQLRDLRPHITTYGNGGNGGGITNHNDLSGLQGGAVGEYHHLTSLGFDADGALTFSSNANNSLFLNANGITDQKVVVNNTFGGKADFDIFDGNLMLASTTRITNAGAGWLTALDLANGGLTNAGSITGVTNLTVSASSSLQNFSFAHATGTSLFADTGRFDNLRTVSLGLTDLTYTNSSGTHATSTSLFASKAIFTDLSATNATFTHLVVMQETDVQNLSFLNATGGNLVTYGSVSSTFISVLNSILGYATSHNMVVDETLRVGTGNFPIIGNSVAQFGGDVDDYLQVNIQNHSDGNNASSDYIATSDNGDDSNYYIDFGINSSNYNNPDYSIGGANDGYLYANGRNLTIGTASASTAVIFHAGGTTAADEKMRITSDGFVGIGTTSPSSTLDVLGDARISNILTVKTATATELFWGGATGTSLYVGGFARLPLDTLIDNKSVCLLDGTNCPTGTTPNLQTVTNTGNTTTRALQFGGGTSTSDFRFLADLTINGLLSGQGLTFTYATGNGLNIDGLASLDYLRAGDTVLNNATAHNMVVDETLRVGVGEFPIIGSSVAQFGGSTNTYLQVNIQNHSTGTYASSDYIATADIGDDFSYFMDVGVANSNFNDPRWSIIKPLDGYVYSQGGDLNLGATSGSTNIIMFAGGASSTDEIMRLTSSGFVGIGTTNPSSTLDVLGNARISNILTVKTATATELFWGNATGSRLLVSDVARLPFDTKINGISVCLLDGTNCPSGASPNLQTVTNSGNTTTRALQFGGGTSTADFRFLADLTIDGLFSAQRMTFTYATGTGLSLDIVSSTRLISGDATLANTTMANATASNLIVDQSLRVGIGNFPIIGNSVAQFGGDIEDYLQINIQNRSASSVASSDFVATADNGDDSNYYIDFGINSSNYNNPDYSISGANDGYLYSNGRNLTIGTASASTAVIFHAGGTLDTDEKMRITSSGYVGIGTTNPSSTLDVLGDARISNILTVKTATATELFWNRATGTQFYISSLARLPADTKINNTSVCLLDGTNCPSSAASNLQTVSNAGNTTTRALQFGGGTSTAGFRFQTTLTVDGKTTLTNVSSTDGTLSGYLNVAGKTTLTNVSGTNATLSGELWATAVSTSRALFINATGTNLALVGRVNSNLVPQNTATYSLGTSALRWQNIYVSDGLYVSSTIQAPGGIFTNVTTSNLYVANRVTSDLISISDTKNLGATGSRWNNIYLNGNVFATGTLIGSSLRTYGDATIGGNLMSDNNLRSMGTSTARWGSAFLSGNVYASGTLISSGLLSYGNANPGTTDIYDLGTSSLRWNDLFATNIYASGTSQAANLRVYGPGRFDGRVTISNAPEKSEISWASSNISAVGIESVRSLVVFNDYMYAGQGDGAGNGDIQVCNPAGGGDTNLCDNAADWSASLDNAAATRINSMLVYKGRLYDAEGNGAGLGIVRYCRPELTGSATLCEAADWATANFPAGPQQVRQLYEYGGYLYAANDTGAISTASVAVCNPANAGNVNDCDNAGDWTNVAMPTAGYEQALALVSFNNILHLMTGASNGDNDIFTCNPSNAGNALACDNATDWTLTFNSAASGWESWESAAVYNGGLYLGAGQGNADGDLFRCDAADAGSDFLCDNATDFVALINNTAPNNITRIPALMAYDGDLFIGYEGATGMGDVMRLRDSFVTTSNDGTGFEATYSFVNYRGVLYAGRGNAAGNGQVWYYQKPRTASYDLLFEAGSSTGSMWFSNESFNYPGEGTPYAYQNGIFKFSHGILTEAGAYDLAETYRTEDSSLRPGDVVSLDSFDQGSIEKTSVSYDKKLLGVVSTKPGFTLSGPQDGETRPVALIGRVPVKISGENGDIEVGDPLTSASLPGYAMKATRPGMIIGNAMESFSSTTHLNPDLASGTSATGSIMMIVQTGYYFGEEDTPVGQLASFLGQTTTTQVLQQAFQGDVYAIQQVAGGLIDPQVAQSGYLQSAEFAQIDTLVVRSAALVAGDLTVGGDTRLLGHVVVSDKTAGIVDLPPGESYIDIVFGSPFEELPVVVVTPESDAQEFFTPWMGKFRIAKKTINGFRIEVDDGACADPTVCGRTMKFNWMAVGLQIGSATTTAVTSPEATTGPTVDDTTATPPVIEETEVIGSQPDTETVESVAEIPVEPVGETATEPVTVDDAVTVEVPAEEPSEVPAETPVETSTEPASVETTDVTSP